MSPITLLTELLHQRAKMKDNNTDEADSRKLVNENGDLEEQKRDIRLLGAKIDSLETSLSRDIAGIMGQQSRNTAAVSQSTANSQSTVAAVRQSLDARIGNLETSLSRDIAGIMDQQSRNTAAVSQSTANSQSAVAAVRQSLDARIGNLETSLSRDIAGIMDQQSRNTAAVSQSTANSQSAVAASKQQEIIREFSVRIPDEDGYRSFQVNVGNNNIIHVDRPRNSYSGQMMKIQLSPTDEVLATSIDLHSTEPSQIKKDLEAADRFMKTPHAPYPPAPGATSIYHITVANNHTNNNNTLNQINTLNSLHQGVNNAAMVAKVSNSTTCNVSNSVGNRTLQSTNTKNNYATHLLQSSSELASPSQSQSLALIENPPLALVAADAKPLSPRSPREEPGNRQSRKLINKATWSKAGRDRVAGWKDFRLKKKKKTLLEHKRLGG